MPSTADKSLLAAYTKGKYQPVCTNKTVGSIVTLNCVPGEKWQSIGDQGNASAHLVDVTLNYCLVCFTKFLPVENQILLF